MAVPNNDHPARGEGRFSLDIFIMIFMWYLQLTYFLTDFEFWNKILSLGSPNKTLLIDGHDQGPAVGWGSTEILSQNYNLFGRCSSCCLARREYRFSYQKYLKLWIIPENFKNMSKWPNFKNMSKWPNFKNMSKWQNFKNMSKWQNFKNMSKWQNFKNMSK